MMRFRPCIDIHNGKVKQIVGGSLKDEGNVAKENFTSGYDAAFYARLYRKDALKGGHIILLNPEGSKYYKATKRQALLALAAYPGGLQIGGGINARNAPEYLEAGASHVIVTSFVFRDGQIKWENLKNLRDAAGRDHIVIDVSCRRRGGDYYIVTDRWQKFTEVRVSHQVLTELSEYCDEFLVHGVDAEGKASGAEEDLVQLLSGFDKIPVTYAGGIGSAEDLKRFREISKGKLDFTIGSALVLFGGAIPYESIRYICH